MPSFFTCRAKGKVALTESNRREDKGRAEVCQLLKKHNEASACHYILPPQSGSLFGERCGPTLAD